MILTDFEKPYFLAGGQVGHPGKYELLSPTTVVAAIAIAGGFNDQAKHSQVLFSANDRGLPARHRSRPQHLSPPFAVDPVGAEGTEHSRSLSHE